MKKLNKYISALIASGFSVIPIAEGEKRPHQILGSKHDLLVRRATPEEIEKWIAAGVTSWAIAGGKVSNNLVTLDFDEKHYPGLYDLWHAKLSDDQKKVVDACHKNSTRNKGNHLRYRTETPQPTIKLASRVEFNQKAKKEEIVTTVETRGEGSYALIPPSAGYTTTQGSLLDLPLVPDKMHEELIGALRALNEVEDEPATDYEWKPGDTVPGDRPGDRLNAKTSWNEILEPHGWVEETKNHWRRPGKDKGKGISATTDYDNKPMFYVFSSSASPFKENKGYSKFHAFALLNHGGDFKAAAKAAADMYPDDDEDENDDDDEEQEDGGSSQASILLKNTINRKDMVLFHDEQGDGHISLGIAGHQEIRACKSKVIKRWLSREVYQIQKKAPSSETIKNILAVLEGKACFEGPEIELQNRAAWHNDELWYDLTNKEWQVIRINKDGWEIVDKPPILFKRYSHHKAQVMPTKNGDVKLFLNYINITNPEHQLLFLVYLISCFIPDFPHVMLVVFGAQGSSKSTLSKLSRLTVDPSMIDVVALPSSQRELVQVLAHHHFLFFDNVSYVSEESSDTLCRAVTGSGFSKRELYSDDDDIIYTFKRCIGINGINLVTTRPDLLERSLLIELARIEEAKNKSEKELYENFKKDLPAILGGVLDTLVKAIRIQPTIKVESLPRMADWALWGCAIAEALGYTKEEFLDAYRNNRTRQTEMLLNENIVATAITTFMEGKDEWRDTPTELLRQLSTHASLSGIDTREKYWPTGANILSRKLNELSTPLKQMGISVIISTSGVERYIHIQKTGKRIAPKNDSVSQTDGTDDTDDVIPTLTEEPLPSQELPF